MKVLAVVMVIFMPAADGGVTTATFTDMPSCLRAKQQIEMTVRAGAFVPRIICLTR